MAHLVWLCCLTLQVQQRGESRIHGQEAEGGDEQHGSRVTVGVWLHLSFFDFQLMFLPEDSHWSVSVWVCVFVWFWCWFHQLSINSTTVCLKGFYFWNTLIQQEFFKVKLQTLINTNPSWSRIVFLLPVSLSALWGVRLGVFRWRSPEGITTRPPTPGPLLAPQSLFFLYWVDQLLWGQKANPRPLPCFLSFLWSETGAGCNEGPDPVEDYTGDFTERTMSLNYIRNFYEGCVSRWVVNPPVFCT